MQINPNAILIIALTTVIGAVFSHLLIGLLVGLAFVTVASMFG